MLFHKQRLITSNEYYEANYLWELENGNKFALLTFWSGIQFQNENFENPEGRTNFSSTKNKPQRTIIGY